MATVKLNVKELNECLGCKVCGGYFRDAHTISECLHTFCKVCLNREFQMVHKHQFVCPTCRVALGPLPWQKIIYDRTLQGIVDKIFPYFAEEDRKLGRVGLISVEAANNTMLLQSELEFAANAEKKRIADEAEIVAKRMKSATEEEDSDAFIMLRALPLWNESVPEEKRLPLLSKPLLKVVSDIKVSKIQKFIQKRLAAENLSILPTQIELHLGSRILQPNDSINSAAGSTDPSQNAKDPIIISYKRM